MKITEIGTSVFEEFDIPYAVFVSEDGFVRYTGSPTRVQSMARKGPYCGTMRVFNSRHSYTPDVVSTIHTGKCAQRMINELLKECEQIDGLFD